MGGYNWGYTLKVLRLVNKVFIPWGQPFGHGRGKEVGELVRKNIA
jgi:hypothetical protein